MDIQTLFTHQREFFNSGKTLELPIRRAALRRLHRSILAHEEDIIAALRADLNKSATESYMAEIGMTLSELSYAEAHLDQWAKDRTVHTPLAQFHAKSFVVQQPYGLTLVIAPWNYPFLLSMDPLIGAIAAGNCCILKPSSNAPATSAVLRTVVQDALPSRYAAVVECSRAESDDLLNQPFDKIFFTGSVSTGRKIMETAAHNLIPVTLELGGKSPCIIDHTAKLDLAAKRIVFGKFLNCGQTCVAPDYILVEESVKNDFLLSLQKWITAMYGENALHNDQYVRIINQHQFDRVVSLIDPAKVVIGGDYDKNSLKIQPTVMDQVTLEDPVMQEEIFGPVLPVLTFRSIEEVKEIISHHPTPLALYLFSQDKTVCRRILQEVSFGGGCINDTIIHLATSHMGFGGVGMSGTGAYHGKLSFDTFSHAKSIVKKSTWMDLPFRYAPYSAFSDKILRMFLK